MKLKEYKDILNEIRDIIKGTEWENHVFAVGGCVRDEIMHNNIKDIDIVIDIKNGGINFAKWLEEHDYTNGSVVTYENFGTSMFHLKAFPEHEIEAVHTRSECYHDAKTRNPETSFGTIYDDWTRRDFTINAMYRNISTMELIDFEDRGVNDIKNKIIRTCGDPEIIFNEDPLRVLRMVRFASRYNFEIEYMTLFYAKRFAERLVIISKERITDEFTKMMTFSKSSIKQSLCLLHDLDAFKRIIPEYSDFSTYQLFNVITDIEEHFKCGIKNISVILTKLLYYSWNDDTKKLFKSRYDYIKYVLQTVLSYSNQVTNEVIFLTKMNENLHELCSDISVYIEEHDYEVRRVMNSCGSYDRFYYATICGSKKVYNVFHDDKFSPISLFDEYDEKYEKYYHYKLPITGDDVMEVFNIGPCAEVKKILNSVFNFALINTDKTSRNDCLDFLKYLKEIEDDEWYNF